MQASYDISDPTTLERELAALDKVSRFIPARRLLLVTYNQETMLQRGDRDIEIIPIWKFLLSEL